MRLLVLGLLLFLGLHLVPAWPPLRARLAAALGENRYKALFSAGSALGLLLIVVGYAHAPAEPRLFAPLALAHALAPAAMLASFVLLAAANMKTHMRRWLRHPMLLGVGLWAMMHLLANGEARATLLFGAFLAYCALDLVSASVRGAVRSFTPQWRHDVIAVAAGVLLALAVMAAHRLLFGVAVVPWGI